MASSLADRDARKADLGMRRGSNGAGSDVVWGDRGEGPGPVEHFWAWAVEPHQVVPAVHDRQRVWAVVRAAEVDGDTAVIVGGRGEAVDAHTVPVVGKVALRVVEGDGPEGVCGHIARGERVLAHRQVRVDVDVVGLGFRESSPAPGSAEEVAYGINVLPTPERSVEPPDAFGEGRAASLGVAVNVSVSYTGMVKARLDVAVNVIWSCRSLTALTRLGLLNRPWYEQQAGQMGYRMWRRSRVCSPGPWKIWLM